ncbi:MAG: hypothetical protein ACFFDT_21580 [Candidatus Hodarchaeota archaeon]
MEEFEDSLRKLKDLVQKASLTTKAEIRTVLLVLDETIDRNSFIFELAHLLDKKTLNETHFIFLLAVRGYRSQAKKANILLETLPELTKKVKEEFIGHNELVEVAFIPDEEIPPFERIKEIIRTRTIDLLVIPVPFTKFVKDEVQSETSLGNTIDQIISIILIQHRTPLFFVRSALDYQLPFSNVAVLIRESLFRSDMLGWLLALSKDDAQIDLYYTVDLTPEELNRVGLYYQTLCDWIDEETKQLTINCSSEPLSLKTFCDRMSTEPGKLVIFQAIKDVMDEAEHIINALYFQNSNVLIFPPID